MPVKQLGINRITEKKIINNISKVYSNGQYNRYYDKQDEKQEGFVKKFEEWSTDFFKAQFALATSSATQSLTIALIALNTRGREVIIPSYAFSACPVSVICAGGIPVIAPINDNLSMDIDSLKSLINDRTAAIMAVHMRGFPNDMEAIYKIAKEFEIPLIEDCSQFDGLKIHTYEGWSGYADVAVFSLQTKKILSAGEGGLIITNNEHLYKSMFKLHDPAWDLRGLEFLSEHEETLPLYPGSRMNEVTAAVVYTQIENLNLFTKELRDRRKENHNAVLNLITNRDINGFQLIKYKKDYQPGGNLAIRLEKSSEVGNINLQELASQGICLYPESLTYNDSHFYNGWHPKIKANCITPLSLKSSQTIMENTMIFQLDSDLSKDKIINFLISLK